MRICFVTVEFSKKNQPCYGGLATYLYKIAKILQENGHEPIILVIDNGTGHSYYEGIKVIRKQSKIIPLIYESKLCQVIPEVLELLSGVERGILINNEIRKMHREKN